MATARRRRTAVAESLTLSLKLGGFEDATLAMRQLGITSDKVHAQVKQGATGAAASLGDFRKAMASVSGVAAATAGVLSIFARGNAELQDSLEKATVAFTLASTALRGLGAALRVITNPIFLVVAAIGAAIAVALNWEAVSKAVTTGALAAWTALGAFFATFAQNVSALFRGLGEVLAGAFTLDPSRMRSGLEEIRAGAAGIGEQFAQAAGTAKTAFSDAMDFILNKNAEILAKINAGWVAFADATIAETDLVAKAVADSQIAVAAGLAAGETSAAWTTFTTYFSTQLTTLQDLSRATWASFSSGVGSAVAQSIVFGQSLGESFSKLLQNIAAMVIQTLVEMALQAVISHTLAAAAATTRATVEIADAATVGGAWTWAAAVEEFGLPGILIGAALAAAAIAAIIALGAGLGGAAAGLEDGSATGTYLLHRGERVRSPAPNADLTDDRAG